MRTSGDIVVGSSIEGGKRSFALESFGGNISVGKKLLAPFGATLKAASVIASSLYGPAGEEKENLIQIVGEEKVAADNVNGNLSVKGARHIRLDSVESNLLDVGSRCTEEVLLTLKKLDWAGKIRGDTVRLTLDEVLLDKEKFVNIQVDDE